MSTISTADQIDKIISSIGGWKAEILLDIRKSINESDPNITEEVKWKTASRPEGLPVWSYDGIICLAETWKDKVVLIFTKGVHIDDPKGFFNARLKSSTDRAIEFYQGDNVDESAIRQLVLQAIQINVT